MEIIYSTLRYRENMPINDYRFKLICCYTLFNDEYFGGAYIKPWIIVDIVSSLGVFDEGIVFNSTWMVETTREGLLEFGDIDDLSVLPN